MKWVSTSWTYSMRMDKPSGTHNPDYVTVGVTVLYIMYMYVHRFVKICKFQLSLPSYSRQ